MEAAKRSTHATEGNFSLSFAHRPTLSINITKARLKTFIGFIEEEEGKKDRSSSFALLIKEMNKHQQYERVFDHFDINGDRKISPSELQQCVEAIGGGEELSLAEAEAAVEFLDSDGDGLLGFDDFVRFVEGGGEEEKVHDLKVAFKMYIDEVDDGCGCGFITPKSLRRMLSRLGQYKSVDECKVMIAHFDLNGDGVLNFDEFRIMML